MTPPESEPKKEVKQTTWEKILDDMLERMFLLNFLMRSMGSPNTRRHHVLVMVLLIYEGASFLTFPFSHVMQWKGYVVDVVYQSVYLIA